MTTNYILTIAGSDILSGGGLQADLATFSAHKLFGFLALTSLATVTESGFTITPSDAQLFAQQLDSLKDVPFAAIKIGLLPNRAIALQVLDFIKERPEIPVVLDPVLVFKENNDDEISDMRHLMISFFPHVSLITPNLREAEILAGVTITTQADMEAAARILHDMGAPRVVIKGGSRLSKHKAVDVFYEGGDMAELTADLIHRNNNGAGCTFASSIASNLALGLPALEAVSRAKRFVYQAIANSNDYGVVQQLTE